MKNYHQILPVSRVISRRIGMLFKIRNCSCKFFHDVCKKIESDSSYWSFLFQSCCVRIFAATITGGVWGPINPRELNSLAISVTSFYNFTLDGIVSYCRMKDICISSLGRHDWLRLAADGSLRDFHSVPSC